MKNWYLLILNKMKCLCLNCKSISLNIWSKFIHSNEDFNQRFGCAAPKRWSKYTTYINAKISTSYWFTIVINWQLVAENKQWINVFKTISAYISYWNQTNFRIQSQPEYRYSNGCLIIVFSGFQMASEYCQNGLSMS